MMKSIPAQLLLLLMLTMAQRYSYANPTRTLDSSADILVDKDANIIVDKAVDLVNEYFLGNSTENLNTMKEKLAKIAKSPITRGMLGVIDHLIEVVNYLKDKMSYTYYDDIIRELEIEVDNLPSDLNEDRNKMLLRLYRANTRIITTRVNLKQAARLLKSYCQQLIDIYEENDPSMKLLKYTAQRFNRYAAFVMNLLEEALITYKETQDELSEATTSLKAFHYKLNEAKREVLSGNREKRDLGARNKRAITVGAAIAIGAGAVAVASLATGAVVYAIMRPKDYDNLLGRIERVQGRLDQLFNENEKIQHYISQEIILINDWKNKLESSLLDNHHKLSEDDVRFAIKHIKNNLITLKYACSNYLDHELPAILQDSDLRTYSPIHLIDNQTAIPHIEILRETTSSPSHLIDIQTTIPHIEILNEVTSSSIHLIDNQTAIPHIEILNKATSSPSHDMVHYSSTPRIQALSKKNMD